MTSAKYYEILERDKLYHETNFKNSVNFTFDRFLNSAKRKSTTKNFLVSVFAIIASLFVSLFIAMAIYSDGSLFYRVIEQMFVSPFNSTNWKSTISMISIFAVSALSFIFAEKVGLFNLGISGQMLFGAQLATMMCWYIGSVPNVLGQILVIVVSMLGAAVISTLVGVLKVFLNINEVISSIMFNWIVYYCGSYMLNTVGKNKGMLDAGGMNTKHLKDVASHCWISVGGEGTASGSWLPLLVIMIMLIGISVTILSFSVFGKKISSVGKSNTASLYAGINVKKQQIITMMMSGMIAGLLGAMIYCGYEGSMSVTVTAKTIPQYGFNGISVGLIAMTNPIGVAPVSLLFGMIDISKSSMQAVCGVDPNIAQLMFGVIVYGAAIISAFYFFTPWVWFKQLFYGPNAKKAYQEYNEDIRKHLSNCNNTIDTVLQLRKAKRTLFKLRITNSRQLIKIRRDMENHPFYLANKKRFKNFEEFRMYCRNYRHSYMHVLAGFADMYGKVPAYLKPKFKQTIREHIYKRYGFKWSLLDKQAMTRHCINCQRLYLSEIFNSPSVRDNFKLFAINFDKLNNNYHIKQIKARVWRYYVIYKKIAQTKFNSVVLMHRKNRYDFKHCRFLYVKNAGSKLTKEITKDLRVFSDEVKEYVRCNNTINLISLKFSLRDIKHSKYLTTVHSENVKTKIEGLTESNNVYHLITDRLAVEVMIRTNFQNSKVRVQNVRRKKGECKTIYLVDPQLGIKDYWHLDPTKDVKNAKKIAKLKKKTFNKLKKFIMKKESYALIEQLLISKRELLENEAKRVHLYAPYALADLGSLQVGKPIRRKGAR